MMFTTNLDPVSSSASAARSRFTATVNPGGSKLACRVQDVNQPATYVEAVTTGLGMC